MASVPAFPVFDPDSEKWHQYRQRLNFHFEAYDVKPEKRKAYFLTWIGARSYALLETLVSPKELSDPSTTYIDLISLLDQRYDDTRNILSATYDFYTCFRQDGESVSEYITRLRNKAKSCGFTTSVLRNNPLERALRDMLVIGINDSRIRQLLLKEGDPKLEDAERIALTTEQLQSDILRFNKTQVSMEEVSKITHSNANQMRHFNSTAVQHSSTPRRQRRSTSQSSHRSNRSTVHRHKINSYSASSQSVKNTTTCQACGSTSHQRPECRFKNHVCNYCKNKGHIQRACRKRNNVEQLGYVSSNVNQIATKASVRIQINGQYIVFELDTGANNTIIPISQWKNIGSPKLSPTNIKLKSYNGTPISISGQCTADVSYNGKQFRLPIIVTNCEATALIGLQWIRKLHIDLNQLVLGTATPVNSIQSSYDSIEHITAPPYHPASNGIAERMVRSFKESMARERKSGNGNHDEALRKFLRSYRTTPHTSTNVSPSQMMFNRQPRSVLTLINPRRSHRTQLSKFNVADKVWITVNQGTKRIKWIPATIKQKIGFLVYLVTLADGNVVKRHQNQLRRRSILKPQSSNDFEWDEVLPTAQTQSSPQSDTTPETPVRRYPQRSRRPTIRFSPDSN